MSLTQGAQAGAVAPYGQGVALMMKQYVIRCLRGTSSTSVKIELSAFNFNEALTRCRDNGLQPVAQCLVYSSPDHPKP